MASKITNPSEYYNKASFEVKGLHMILREMATEDRSYPVWVSDEKIFGKPILVIHLSILENPEEYYIILRDCFYQRTYSVPWDANAKGIVPENSKVATVEQYKQVAKKIADAMLLTFEPVLDTSFKTMNAPIISIDYHMYNGFHSLNYDDPDAFSIFDLEPYFDNEKFEKNGFHFTLRKVNVAGMDEAMWISDESIFGNPIFIAYIPNLGSNQLRMVFRDCFLWHVGSTDMHEVFGDDFNIPNYEFYKFIIETMTADILKYVDEISTDAYSCIKYS
jgi:hypothetical protein